MQSIERYGVIALLFLVVTVVAVLMWDTEEGPEEGRSRRAEVAASESSTERPVSRPESRLESRTEPRPERRLRARTEDRPLLRDGNWGEPPSSDNLPPVVPVDEEPLVVRRSVEAAPARKATEESREEPVERSAAPPREERVTSSKRDRIYVVRPGDTLGEIALAQLGTSKLWPQIVELNPGLDPARMKVGARLVLPDITVGAPAEKTGPATEKAPAVATEGYRVQSGDSLWRIAESQLGDGERWREILAANPGLDANRLNVGKVLRMPAGAVAEPAAGETVAKTQSAPSQTKGRVR